MALSDLLAPALQIGATVLDVGGQLARGQAARAVGVRRKAESEFEAKQLEQDAEVARGTGMRAAQDVAMQTQYVNSRALALAAASGAGASDPTVIDVISRTAGEGAYRQALALYQGEALARSDMLKADATRFSGETASQDASAASRAANMGAFSTVLSGGVKAMSMYDKYWSGPR